MILAADYPFLDIFWSMLIFFMGVIWLWMLFTILADVFRRDDLSGWGKAGWSVCLIVLPFLTAFVYIITNQTGMADRNVKQVQAQREQLGAIYGGPAAEIEKGRQLLESGVITEPEFQALKAKALA